MAGTVTLSGWGQPHDALHVIAPDAQHVDYAQYHSVEEALAAIPQADTVIGWSLGGQLAVRAVAAGLIKPKKLVLIAAPFQFVKTDMQSLGMGRDTYFKFYDNFARNALRTLHKAWELVHLGDTMSHYIRDHMEQHDKHMVLAGNWLRWLELLDGYSCEGLDFSRFPQTLLIHGEKDMVVDVAQSRHFASVLPRAELKLLPDAGHAPHWHDTDTIKQWIERL